MAAEKKRIDIDPRTKKILVVVGLADSVLRVIALIDLIRHRRESFRGSKIGWAAALTTINSAGFVPAAYFLLGRRRSRSSS